jgi:hypothetical protein
MNGMINVVHKHYGLSSKEITHHHKMVLKTKLLPAVCPYVCIDL